MCKACRDVLGGYLFRYYGPEEYPSKVNEFEKAFAAHVGAAHCLAVTNCTSALASAGEIGIMRLWRALAIVALVLAFAYWLTAARSSR